MNKIRKLLDEKYVTDYLRKKLLPLYPDFRTIEKIRIIPHKKLIWETTYHVVFEFEASFLAHDGTHHTLPIFCTAHSNESRKCVFKSLDFLWRQGFSSGNLSIPHPLFYSPYFKGTFYRGVEGRNLYYYIRKNDREIIEEMIPRTAGLFAKLHSIFPDPSFQPDKHYARIKTINPGVIHILDRIKNEHPDYFSFYQEAYNIFLTHEKSFFTPGQERWLVHGDAHPENIIRMSSDKIALIDFTDLSLSDFARDLGSFTQQTAYMIGRKINDQTFSDRMCRLFLSEYSRITGINLDSPEILARIKLYHNWTNMRTATHFLLKIDPEPLRAEELMRLVSQDLNIKL